MKKYELKFCLILLFCAVWILKKTEHSLKYYQFFKIFLKNFEKNLEIDENSN